MTKQRKTAASVTAPATETPEVVQTAPQVIPVAEVAEAAEVNGTPEVKEKETRADRERKFREHKVGVVYDDLEVARENPPTFTPATGSKYELYSCSKDDTAVYWTWSLDGRRAYEQLCRFLGWSCEKADKPARTSQVNALKSERDQLLAEVAALKAQMAQANGQAH
jgi:hypothetical protein